jgi:hypothetical protein
MDYAKQVGQVSSLPRFEPPAMSQAFQPDALRRRERKLRHVRTTQGTQATPNTRTCRFRLLDDQGPRSAREAAHVLAALRAAPLGYDRTLARAQCTRRAGRRRADRYDEQSSALIR